MQKKAWYASLVHRGSLLDLTVVDPWVNIPIVGLELASCLTLHLLFFLLFALSCLTLLCFFLHLLSNALGLGFSLGLTFRLGFSFRLALGLGTQVFCSTLKQLLDWPGGQTRTSPSLKSRNLHAKYDNQKTWRIKRWVFGFDFFWVRVEFFTVFFTAWHLNVKYMTIILDNTWHDFSKLSGHASTFSSQLSLLATSIAASPCAKTDRLAYYTSLTST